MDLKEKLLSSFMVLESQQLAVTPKIHELRAKSIREFEKLGFPHKKSEAWRYTAIDGITDKDYTVIQKPSEALDYKDVKHFFLNNIDSYKIVFVDGYYSSHLSETSHEGLDICVMSSALYKPKYEAVVSKYFHTIADPKEQFTTLNTAFSKEGAYIHIPKNKIVNKPVEIVYVSTKKAFPVMFQPRNLIILEENAQIQIIERHQNLGKQEVFTNAVTEIAVSKGALLDYYKIQNDSLKSTLVDNTYISQQNGSSSMVHTFSVGGALTRNNLNYHQEGSYISSNLKGLTIIGEQQHVDHCTLVHHKNPNNTSNQSYRGIFMDQSVGVFNGKIVVDKIAQKTDAFQQNRNIVVSDKAIINTKPQLEIFADDVKCSHGCTVGQLDQKAMFYFKSRGIPEKEARSLLMYAFSTDVIEDVAIPGLRMWINDLIAQKLDVQLGFDL